MGTLIKTLAILFAVSSTANAAEPRYKKNTNVRVKVKAAKKTKVKPKGKNAKETRPNVSADDVLEGEGKVENIRRNQIQLIKQLYRKTKSNSDKSKLLFRLATSYSKIARFNRYQGMELYAKIDSSKGKQKSDYQKKQKAYFDASEKNLANSMKVFNQLINNDQFNDFKQMDRAIYSYAMMVDEEQKRPDLSDDRKKRYADYSRKMYARLIRDYPDSPFIPQANVRFGDYFFEQNSLANAESYYKKALRFKKSKVYNYAHYKLGWVQLNLNRHKLAGNIFLKVAKATQRNKKEQVLNRAAKNDFVTAYAEFGKAELALNAFRKVDAKYSIDMMMRLGNVYLAKGKSKKAVYVYDTLISQRPKDRRVCEWRFNTMQAMLQIGDSRQKTKEAEKLVRMYQSVRKDGTLKGERLQECRDNGRDVVAELATAWHSEMAKTKNWDKLPEVEKLYKLFVEVYPEDKEAGRMEYYYANILWDRAKGENNPRIATERWERAAVAFTDIVKKGKVTPEEKKDSAQAAVSAWQNALKVDPRVTGTTSNMDDAGEIPKKKPIPEREQKMLEAFDIYTTYIKDPKDKELVGMKFRKGRLYWKYNHFDKALPIMEEVIDKHPEHETSEYAVNIILDTYIRTKQFDELIAFVNKMDRKKEWLAEHEDAAERIAQIKSQSLRKKAESLEADAEKSGNSDQYVACGRAYFDIYSSDPEADKAHEILYNAGTCYEKGQSYGDAIQSYRLLRKFFPNTSSAKKASFKLGQVFANVAMYDRAAPLLEEFGSKYGGTDEARSAMGDAVFFRKALGDDEKAIENTRKFVKMKKADKGKKAEAFFNIHYIHEKNKDDDKMISSLREYLKKYGRTGGADRAIVAHTKIGLAYWRQSCPAKTVDGTCIKVKRSRSVVRRGKKRRKKGNNLPTQCGPESKLKVTVIERDRKLVAKAQSAFKSALKVKGLGKVKEDGRKRVGSHYQAAAQFHLIEADYESYLRVPFPSKLDVDNKTFALKPKAKKAFMGYINKKGESAKSVGERYKKVASGSDPHYAIAAGTRIGQISQNFSDQMFSATIPPQLRKGKFAEDRVYGYCDAIAEQTTPLEKQQILQFERCLNTSTKLSWFNDWARLCEKELGQIKPEEYPTASEIRGSANNAPRISTIEGAIEDLPR